VAYNYGGVYNSPTDNTAARSDYAANCGDQNVVEYMRGPASLAQGDDPGYAGWHSSTVLTGVSFERSEIKDAEVSDGASCTIMIGENYLTPDCYFTGTCRGDNESMYTGFNNDNDRCTSPDYPLLQDQEGYDCVYNFGSAHATGCHFVFCDGSVQTINYSINPEIFRRLGNRKDGLAIDGKMF